MVANVDIDGAVSGFDDVDLDERAELIHEQVAGVAQVVGMHTRSLDLRNLGVHVGDLVGDRVDVRDGQSNLLVEVALLLLELGDLARERVG